MDRIASFRSFIARSPTDPFPRYGLAMEHKVRGELREAHAVFAELVTAFPDYVPAYLMAGETLASLGKLDEAASLFERGIEVATRCGDAHARTELEAARDKIEESRR